MQETEHYDLKKPSVEDFYNIADQNGNMDKIDTALHELEEGKADLDPVTGKVRGDQLPDMPYVPTSRKVNGKALSSDIALTAADVGARPSTWTPTAGDVGARPNTWTPTWSEVQSKPTTFTPSAHTHAPADLTSLVPINLGGTGAATAAAARENLGADPAAKGVTTGTASALVLAGSNFGLSDGACVRFRLHIVPDAPTLNVNGTGAKPIVTSKGKPFKGAAVGSWVTVVYSEGLNSFILQGEGGDSGGRYGNGVNQISSYELLIVAGNNPFYGR